MKNKGKILAVDDTPESLKLLTDILESEGYEVLSASSGELALPAAAINPPELVLLDIRMPTMDGYEVCQRLKAQPETRNIPVIFVSAATETDVKVQGFAIGAVDYVTKPYKRPELLARVRTHLDLYRLRNHLEDVVEERTAELKDREERLRGSEKKLKDSLFEFISALSSTLEMRDPYTAGHQRRVAQLAVTIAKELQLSEEQVEGLHLAGVVHDIGKIRIPAEILSNPRKLNEMEFGLIKGHSQAGYEILQSIEFPWPIAQIVLQHHERMDGTGYPQGLKGDAILCEARILAVADVVEAITSDRPYRPGLGIEAALSEIMDKRGTSYDPAVVDACVRLFHEGRFALT